MDSINFNNRINIQEILEKTNAIQAEIGKVIVGQTDLLEMLMVALIADGHVLLEGVPGVAKTLTSKLLAKTINVQFSRIQFTPDLMPSDVIGTNIFSPQTNKFEFKKGPIFGNIILIDEINRAPAKTQSSLFEVMEEKAITVDGNTYKMEPPFLVIATQNPIEHEGTYQLPEAQLDRFMFKLIVNYPSQEEEMLVLKNFMLPTSIGYQMNSINSIINAEELATLRGIAKEVLVDDTILTFITKIVAATRTSPALYLGASPRASLALMNASKAFAALQNRDFVIPEDVIQVAPSILRHRIALTPEKEMEGVEIDDLIIEILKQNEVPR
jgi:MoxR-like ATPase